MQWPLRLHRTEKSGSAVEAGAEFIGCGTVAAVSSMRVHLRQRLDVIADTAATAGSDSPASSCVVAYQWRRS